MLKKVEAYIDLIKIRILVMVVAITALGFLLAKQNGLLAGESVFVDVRNSDWLILIATLIGTAFTCAGGSALNHYLERDIDCKMARTSKRPISVGSLESQDVLVFGVLMVIFGTSFLIWQVNILTGFLALLTAFLYVLVYTPLKRVTWLNTCVGAIPGAIPPLGGWAAANNELELGAWILFAILFIWQHPHFYAIAWMYKEDYRLGGLKMLPVVDDELGSRTFRQILFFSLILIPISMLPSIVGKTGLVYLVGSCLLGLFMLSAGLVLSKTKTISDAKRLLQASLVYLPSLFFLMTVDINI